MVRGGLQLTFSFHVVSSRFLQCFNSTASPKAILPSPNREQTSVRMHSPIQTRALPTAMPDCPLGANSLSPNGNCTNRVSTAALCPTVGSMAMAEGLLASCKINRRNRVMNCLQHSSRLLLLGHAACRSQINWQDTDWNTAAVTRGLQVANKLARHRLKHCCCNTWLAGHK